MTLVRMRPLNKGVVDRSCRIIIWPHIPYLAQLRPADTMSTEQLLSDSSSGHSGNRSPSNYGAHDQPENPNDLEGRVVGLQGKERVWVVARCALIACLASVVVGMNGGFNSPALVELENENLTTKTQYISKTSGLHSLFGVSRMV